MPVALPRLHARKLSVSHASYAPIGFLSTALVRWLVARLRSTRCRDACLLRLSCHQHTGVGCTFYDEENCMLMQHVARVCYLT